MNKMLKRFLPYLLPLVLLCGCEGNAKKNIGDDIASLSDGEEVSGQELTVKEQLIGMDEGYTEKFSSKNGNKEIFISADIVLPVDDYLSVTTYEEIDFTKDDEQRLLERFFDKESILEVHDNLNVASFQMTFLPYVDVPELYPEGSEYEGNVIPWQESDQIVLHTYEGQREGLTYVIQICYGKQKQGYSYSYTLKNAKDLYPEVDADIIAYEQEYNVPDDTERTKNKEEDNYVRLKEIAMDYFKEFNVVPEEEASNLVVFSYADPKGNSSGYEGYLFDDGYEYFAYDDNYFNDIHLGVAKDRIVKAMAYSTAKNSEVINEKANLISFESLKEVIHKTVYEEIDEDFFPGNTIVFSELELKESKVYSPDEKSEFTMMPVWILRSTTQANGRSCSIKINAMDGSVIGVYYIDENTEYIEEDLR